MENRTVRSLLADLWFLRGDGRPAPRGLLTSSVNPAHVADDAPPSRQVRRQTERLARKARAMEGRDG